MLEHESVLCVRALPCVSLLGIITMKPNTAWSSLRCTANVSALNKRCAGSISQLWSQGLLLGRCLLHITLSAVDVPSRAWGQNRLLGYLLPGVFVYHIKEINGGVFLERKLSIGMWPNILWPCFNMETKADWVMIEIHTSLFLGQRTSNPTQEQVGLFIRYIFRQKQHTRGTKNALLPFLHWPTTAFNPLILSPTHTCPFVCLHPYAVQRHLWWHHDTVLLHTLSSGHCGSS